MTNYIQALLVGVVVLQATETAAMHKQEHDLLRRAHHEHQQQMEVQIGRQGDLSFTEAQEEFQVHGGQTGSCSLTQAFNATDAEQQHVGTCMLLSECQAKCDKEDKLCTKGFNWQSDNGDCTLFSGGTLGAGTQLMISGDKSCAAPEGSGKPDCVHCGPPCNQQGMMTQAEMTSVPSCEEPFSSTGCIEDAADNDCNEGMVYVWSSQTCMDCVSGIKISAKNLPLNGKLCKGGEPPKNDATKPISPIEELTEYKPFNKDDLKKGIKAGGPSTPVVDVTENEKQHLPTEEKKDDSENDSEASL